MKACCKNCTEAICHKGLSGKVYFCMMNPIDKDKLVVGMPKFKKVNPSSVCEDYTSRMKEE